jgi:hypothetical protein
MTWGILKGISLVMPLRETEPRLVVGDLAIHGEQMGLGSNANIEDLDEGNDDEAVVGE